VAPTDSLWQRANVNADNPGLVKGEYLPGDRVREMVCTTEMQPIKATFANLSDATANSYFAQRLAHSTSNNATMPSDTCVAASLIHAHTCSTLLFLKSVVFWDVMPCGSCKDRRFGGS
jgi:hypothetical protein